MNAVLLVLMVALAIALVATLVHASSVRTQAARAQHDAAQARHDSAQARERAAAAEHRAAYLARYQSVVDAEATAAQIRTAAEHHARQVNESARQQAQAMLANASAAQAQAGASAQHLLASANSEAQRVVAAAKREADSIAADARRTVDEASRLESTIRALKNVVDGYGDAYIVPTAGLLDDLAEHFGHDEAGERLKAARKRTKAMAKAGEAAACDYVEAARRETAIRFVVDAFNGKTDTILADAKEDNFGTLAQKIRDAFALVNQNGAAFRNARILPAYLEARLDELKWGVVAHELRVREREEQRELKERIREEERAQREFERAQKEAQKEEETLRKALEKARREVEQSNEADRAKFDAKLRELQDKLTAAEEKNQRAVSMAQQTKAGHVYVISNVGSFGEHVYKIGMTRRLEPRDRVRELGDASVPFEFDIHALIPVDDAPAVECALQKKFVNRQMNKVNPRKEFFRVNLEEIRVEVEKLGIPVAWTMTAACREYQETVALERALERGEAAAAAWREAQMKSIEADARAPQPEMELEASA